MIILFLTKFVPSSANTVVGLGVLITNFFAVVNNNLLRDKIISCRITLVEQFGSIERI